jgi:SAM-dependent methyltransferase
MSVALIGAVIEHLKKINPGLLLIRTQYVILTACGYFAEVLMASVFIAMAYRNTYDAVYQDVIYSCLTDAGFKVIRVDKIQKSSLINKDIEDGIDKADLVVIEVSEESPNVYFEFGIAIAKGKELLILAKKGSKIPFDTRQWRHLFYDINDLDELRKIFFNWMERTIAYRKHSPRSSAKLLSRGDVFPDIVDATLYIDTSDKTIDDRIWKDVRSGGLLPCFYSYYTDIGTENWLQLCQDPSYTIFRESVSALTENVEQILDTLGNSFVESSPDFVSLGPGNGQKDLVILKGLVKRLIESGNSPEIYYYPIDISPRMLSTAVRTVSRDPDLKDWLKIKVVEGNFEDIRAFCPIFDFRPEPNLFSFLGNTLGNISDEISFLNLIKNAMYPEDILLLEVRLRNDNIQPGGKDLYRHGLNFSPLQRLGVEYDKDKIEIKKGKLSQVPKTETVSVHYKDICIKGTNIKDVTLSCVNFYDEYEMQKVLKAPPLGFTVINVIKSNGLAIYILQLPLKIDKLS